MRVLVVEDFEPMARAIVTGLRREGMAVDAAHDGDAALDQLAVTRYDVVVLDRDLPGVHGDEICRRLAAGRSPGRILMLTAARGLTDRVEGLNLGADDHLAKPFDFPELIARIRALGRRVAEPQPPVLQCGDIKLDPASRTASRAGQRLALSARELAVLEYLLSRARLTRPVVRPTLRTRMALLYAALICGSGIALVGIIQGIGEAVDPGLFVHRRHISGPIQPDAIHAGHLASPIPFIGSSLFWTDLVGLTIMAVFSLVLGWLIAGRFVRPLRAIITTSRDISASNLHRRLGLRGRDDEFTELGQTLDDLFARLEASFDSQRHFIANASHELRTPLAAGRALLQVAIADPEPTVEKLLATCEELVELGDRQERLIAALLTLANSQRGLELPEPLDLADVTGKAVLDRRRDAERNGISLNTGGRRHNGRQHRNPHPARRGGGPVPAVPAARHPADPPRRRTRARPGHRPRHRRRPWRRPHRHPSPARWPRHRSDLSWSGDGACHGAVTGAVCRPGSRRRPCR